MAPIPSCRKCYLHARTRQSVKASPFPCEPAVTYKLPMYVPSTSNQSSPTNAAHSSEYPTTGRKTTGRKSGTSNWCRVGSLPKNKPRTRSLEPSYLPHKLEHNLYSSAGKFKGSKLARSGEHCSLARCRVSEAQGVCVQEAPVC